MTVFWAGATAVFLVVEGVTVGLTSIWFALGSAAGLIVSLLGGPLWLQVTMFLIVSMAALWVTRPLAKKYVNARSSPTNADRVIGEVGIVIAEINNIAGTGSVAIGGRDWTARASDGSVIPRDTLVKIERIEGVKLIVSTEKKEEPTCQKT